MESKVAIVSGALAGQPIAGVPSALPILIKGGIEVATRSLAIEYAPRGIYLDAASFVSGEILHVDGGAHAGKWA